jgi:hypothetical protein
LLSLTLGVFDGSSVLTLFFFFKKSKSGTNMN